MVARTSSPGQRRKSAPKKATARAKPKPQKASAAPKTSVRPKVRSAPKTQTKTTAKTPAEDRLKRTSPRLKKQSEVEKLRIDRKIRKLEREQQIFRKHDRIMKDRLSKGTMV